MIQLKVKNRIFNFFVEIFILFSGFFLLPVTHHHVLTHLDYEQSADMNNLKTYSIHVLYELIRLKC